MKRAERRRVWILSSWLISAIVHFSVTAVVAVTLRPAGRGESAANTLVVSIAAADPVEMELAPFTASALLDTGPGEAELLSLDTTEQQGDLVSDLVLSEPEIAPPLQRPEPVAIADVEIPAPHLASPNRREEEPQADASPAAKAEFFGTVAHGDRFVYILDMSSSMENTPDKQGRTRFDRARDELIRSIEQLHDGQGFCVTLFSDKTKPMFDKPDLLNQFLRANPENKRRLQGWLLAVKPNGGTNPNEALERGVALRPSAVFLLSDGVFDVEQPKSDALFRKAGGDREGIIEGADRQRIPIHTIAYEEAVGAKNMQELSKGSGGSYRFVREDGKVEVVPAAPPPAAPNANTATVKSTKLSAEYLEAAKDFESHHRYRQAQTAYRRVIVQFPGTAEAAEAEAAIKRLAGQKKKP